MASQSNLAVTHCYPMAIRQKISTSLKQQNQIFSFRVGFEKQKLSAQRFLGLFEWTSITYDDWSVDWLIVALINHT